MKALIGLAFVLVAVTGCDADDLSYLRCSYAQTIPADPSRLAYISIDPEHHVIRFSERGEVLDDTTDYRMTEMNETTVKGSYIDKNGDETRLAIDRLSGRANLFVDVTRETNIGQHDIKPGKQTWSSMSLNCQATKPVI